MEKKITYPWTLLKEPKFISAMWGFAYTFFAGNGVIFIWFTPNDLITNDGWPISLITGYLILLGGILGLVSLHGGQWFMERAAILFNICGLGCYSYTIWKFDNTLSEALIRTFFTLAIISVVLARFYKIRGLTLDPYKN